MAQRDNSDVCGVSPGLVRELGALVLPLPADSRVRVDERGVLRVQGVHFVRVVRDLVHDQLSLPQGDIERTACRATARADMRSFVHGSRRALRRDRDVRCDGHRTTVRVPIAAYTHTLVRDTVRDYGRYC